MRSDKAAPCARPGERSPKSPQTLEKPRKTSVSRRYKSRNDQLYMTRSRASREKMLKNPLVFWLPSRSSSTQKPLRSILHVAIKARSHKDFRNIDTVSIFRATLVQLCRRLRIAHELPTRFESFPPKTWQRLGTAH